MELLRFQLPIPKINRCAYFIIMSTDSVWHLKNVLMALRNFSNQIINVFSGYRIVKVSESALNNVIPWLLGLIIKTIAYIFQQCFFYFILIFYTQFYTYRKTNLEHSTLLSKKFSLHRRTDRPRIWKSAKGLPLQEFEILFPQHEHLHLRFD